MKNKETLEKWSRAIKDCVQLVTLSNDCFLFSRQELQEALRLNFNSWELTKNPTKRIFIGKNEDAQSKISPEKKYSFAHLQLASSIFITKKGFCPAKDYSFPKRLYLDFINLKSKKDLAESAEIFPFFCVFPNYRESQELKEKYRKAGIPESDFPFAINAHGITERLKKEAERNQKMVRKVNIDFVWKKRTELKNFFELYEKKELRYHKLLWLNEQLENVSDQLFAPQNLPWREKHSALENDYRRLDGMEKIKSLPILPSYRIYGHFAYCCLELYLDIVKGGWFFCCENCGQYNHLSGNKTKKRCDEIENEACFREVQAKKKKKWRSEKNEGI